MTPHTWRKSSRSQSGADCIESSGALNRIRDSKNGDGPTLSVDVRALVEAVKAGRLGPR